MSFLRDCLEDLIPERHLVRVVKEMINEKANIGIGLTEWHTI